MGTLTINATNGQTVAAGASYTVPLPSGKSLGNYQTAGATITTSDGSVYPVTVSFGASVITVTNPTGRDIASGGFDFIDLQTAGILARFNSAGQTEVLIGPKNTESALVSSTTNLLTGRIKTVSTNVGYANIPVTNPDGLARFKAALADAIYNPPTIWCVGDSITTGVNYDGTATDQNTLAGGDQYGFPGHLRTLFARMFGVAEAGFIIGQEAGAGARVATSGTVASAASTGINGLTKTVTSAGTLTFSLPSCTGYDIIYYEHNGTAYADGSGTGPTTGGFTHDVDAGGAVAVVAASPWDSYKVASVTGLSQAAHSLVIAGTSANTTQIVGVRYHSGSGVAVGRFGRGGYSSADVLGKGTNSAQTTAGQHRLLNAFGMAAPALVIIPLGHNDCTLQATAGQLTTLDVYQANMQDMIDVVVAAGGCVLLVSEPDPLDSATPVVGGSGYREYWAVAQALAVSNDHVAHIQLFDNWGDHAAAAALGYMVSGNNIHPLRKGYGSMARLIMSAINP